MWLLAPTTAPLVKLPSPQLMRMLLTVSVPGSTMAPRVRLYGLPSLTLAAPDTVVVGSTLLTVTPRVTVLPGLPLPGASSSVAKTDTLGLAGPSAKVQTKLPPVLVLLLAPRTPPMPQDGWAVIVSAPGSDRS